MIFGSTRVSVLRTVDPPAEGDYGDPVEADDVALSGLPVWVEQGTLTRRDDADGQRLTLSGYWVSVRASTPFEFQPTDRLRDERTGDVLQVETTRRGVAWGGARQRLFCTMSA